MTRQKWLFALISVAIFAFILSLRQLSDPDLGFHLKYGSWITLNHAIPSFDQSTYTVSDHAYTDMHWLFQVLLYQLYRIGGYPLISLMFCNLAMVLFLLFLLRLKLDQIPLKITTPALFAAFIMFDPRLSTRPEMLTFLFLISIIIILESYVRGKRSLLALLPLVMILWCNTHALFILGLVVICTYLYADTIRKKRVDRRLMVWSIITLTTCLINPYGIDGLLFPFELLSRFSPDNLYNQHIQEFIPFFAQKTLLLRDYLFLALILTCLLFILFKFNSFKLYELILILLFGLSGILSVRNIPLGVIIILPIVCRQLNMLSGIPGQASQFTKDSFRLSREKFLSIKLSTILPYVMIVIPLAFTLRLITNDYYLSSNSFNKTGIGVNTSHQPYLAAEFLRSNNLDGKILNSLGFGGWLSWRLPQPVFIDGRLEVMQESLYQELTDSWDGGLPKLVEKYQVQIICYNYLKYYPWTNQLRDMENWRLVWVDPVSAIFIEKSYRPDIPDFPLSRLPVSDALAASGNQNNWFVRFYKQADYPLIDSIHLSIFRKQMSLTIRQADNEEKARIVFNAANDRYKNNDIHGAILLFDSAICLKPSYAKAFNNRGIVRALVLHDYENAIHDFNRAIEIEPEYGDAYFGRGSVYYSLQQPELAIRDWQKAKALGNAGASRMLLLHGSPK